MDRRANFADFSSYNSLNAGGAFFSFLIPDGLRQTYECVRWAKPRQRGAMRWGNPEHGLFHPRYFGNIDSDVIYLSSCFLANGYVCKWQDKNHFGRACSSSVL